MITRWPNLSVQTSDLRKWNYRLDNLRLLIFINDARARSKCSNVHIQKIDLYVRDFVATSAHHVDDQR